MVARAWVLIFFTAPFFETVEKVYNFRAAYWFSLPFAYKRKLECEVSPPQGEVAQSARGAGLAQHITACYKHDVMFCTKLTIEQNPHYSARRRAAQLYVSKALGFHRIRRTLPIFPFQTGF